MADAATKARKRDRQDADMQDLKATLY